MSFWSAMVAIAAIIAFAITRVEKYRAQGGFDGPRPPLDVDPRAAATTGELLREVENLRERVRTLERITTDNHQTLSISQEIENLRDR